MAPRAPLLSARRRRAAALIESALAGAAGGALGWLVTRPFGLAPFGMFVGGANGLVSGRRRIYDWRRPAGVAAMVLDSTWALVPTAAGLCVHAVNLVSPSAVALDEPRRAGYHVYAGGFRLRRGFVLTAGNVVTGVGGPVRLPAGSPQAEHRRSLVERHEATHVWQGRLFGPLFPLAYGVWMVGGALAGTAVWLRRRDESWFPLVETAAYYDNPFEWWAYRRAGNWPPAGANPRLVWGRGATVGRPTGP